MSTAAHVSYALPDTRRQLGAYYTPESLAAPLVAWALRGPKHRRVLDPSHGGGVFLSRALLELGSGATVYGVDVDESARVHELGLVERGLPSANLLRRDFLDVTIDDFQTPFDSIVGNPPYIRHHMLATKTKTERRRRLQVGAHALDGRADLWAYFLFHACSMLRPGGRLAFVLPGAFQQADYAEAVRNAMTDLFGAVATFRLRERVFAGAAESSVVLLADEFGMGPCELDVHEVDTVTSLSAEINARTSTEVAVTMGSASRPKPLKTLPEEARALLDDLTSSLGATTLDEHAEVKIGVVTGANAFFIRSSAEVSPLLGQGVTSRAIVSKSRDLHNPRFGHSDLSALGAEGSASQLLLIEADAPLHEALRTALDTAKGDGLHLRSHSRRRTPWYSVTDDSAPHAFLPYMGSSPPHLIRNDAHALCTNGVHRIYWKQPESSDGFVAYSWTSLFGLAAELEGRHYGGGVLKTEPSDAKKLPMISLDDGTELLSEIDRVSRVKSRSETIEHADQLVLVESLGLDLCHVEAIRDAGRRLRERRTGLLRRVD